MLGVQGANKVYMDELELDLAGEISKVDRLRA